MRLYSSPVPFWGSNQEGPGPAVDPWAWLKNRAATGGPAPGQAPSPMDHINASFGALPHYGPQNPQGMPSSGNVAPGANVMSPQPMASQGLPPPQQQQFPQGVPMPQPRPQPLPFYGPQQSQAQPATADTANGGDLIKKFMAQLQNAGAGGTPGAYGTTSTM